MFGQIIFICEEKKMSHWDDSHNIIRNDSFYALNRLIKYIFITLVIKSPRITTPRCVNAKMVTNDNMTMEQLQNLQM